MTDILLLAGYTAVWIGVGFSAGWSLAKSNGDKALAWVSAENRRLSAQLAGRPPRRPRPKGGRDD